MTSVNVDNEMKNKFFIKQRESSEELFLGWREIEDTESSRLCFRVYCLHQGAAGLEVSVSNDKVRLGSLQ